MKINKIGGRCPTDRSFSTNYFEISLWSCRNSLLAFLVRNIRIEGHSFRNIDVLNSYKGKQKEDNF